MKSPKLSIIEKIGGRIAEKDETMRVVGTKTEKERVTTTGAGNS